MALTCRLLVSHHEVSRWKSGDRIGHSPKDFNSVWMTVRIPERHMDLLILKCNKAANEPLALIIHSFYSAVTHFCIFERRAKKAQMHYGSVCVILILLAGGCIFVEQLVIRLPPPPHRYKQIWSHTCMVGLFLKQGQLRLGYFLLVILKRSIVWAFFVLFTTDWCLKLYFIRAINSRTF